MRDPLSDKIKPTETDPATAIARVARQNADDSWAGAEGTLKPINTDLGMRNNQVSFLSATGVDHDNDDLS